MSQLNLWSLENTAISLLQHPSRVVAALLTLFILRRAIIRFFFPAPFTVAARIPTYLPFGIDFIAWSIYHNATSQDIILWNKIFWRYGRGSLPYTVEAVLGPDHVIFTADHENIKSILALQFSDYGKGAKFHRDWKEFLGDSTFATDGRQWQDARHMIRPLFLRERIEGLSVFEKHTRKLLRLFNGPNGQRNNIDVVNPFFRFTLDVATDFLLGVGVNSLDNPKEKFAVAFAEVQKMQRLIQVSGPLQPLVSKVSYRASIKIVNSFVEQFINRTLSLPISELENLAKNDKDYTFLSALALHTRDPAIIRDQLVAVLLAGRDTTAGTLSWAIYELSARPDVVKKLRAEIFSKLKPGDTPNFADLKSMKYLQAILSETLRLYPIISFNMRIALKDTTLPHGGDKDGFQPISVKKTP
ncbi:cytochrome P450 [Amylocarpus encephaloides]|uniref:Cytochrome P450 n=1 Tax=Amylocarpus encephaloides TaxID=45428 RepID=A0A9P8C203_9HELO|nr:cytochrome P450 [Amylocarpus encephaloides]